MSMRIFEALSVIAVLLRKQESRSFGAALVNLGTCLRRSTAGYALVVLLPLGACQGSNEVPEAPADADGKLVCAVDGAAEMTEACLLERVDSPEGQILVVHHPEGGFRRFRIVRDGRGVVPADGSEPSKLFIAAENRIDVLVGGDRYRFPATIGPKADGP